MKIETKYDIGDEVWSFCNHNFKPKKFGITCVRLNSEWHEKILIEYEVCEFENPCNLLRIEEDDLFTTKEECERAYNEFIEEATSPDLPF